MCVSIFIHFIIYLTQQMTRLIGKFFSLKLKSNFYHMQRLMIDIFFPINQSKNRVCKAFIIFS